MRAPTKTHLRLATPAAVRNRIPELRRSLVDRRRATLQQAARSEEDLRRLGENVEAEAEDEAQEETTTLLLARLDARDRRIVDAIDRALRRMAAGTYGRCAACGHAIPIARLAVLPEAATCVGCPDPSAAMGSPRAG
jgi:DnaK suppressor protein